MKIVVRRGTATAQMEITGTNEVCYVSSVPGQSDAESCKVRAERHAGDLNFQAPRNNWNDGF